MDKEKVLTLAKLSRVKISPEEAENLSHEFEAILNYVGEVKEVAATNRELTPEHFPVRNVMRVDTEGHESGMYTEQILSQAPEREGNYVVVKKIL